MLPARRDARPIFFLPPAAANARLECDGRLRERGSRDGSCRVLISKPWAPRSEPLLESETFRSKRFNHPVHNSQAIASGS